MTLSSESKKITRFTFSALELKILLEIIYSCILSTKNLNTIYEVGSETFRILSRN